MCHGRRGTLGPAERCRCLGGTSRRAGFGGSAKRKRRMKNRLVLEPSVEPPARLSSRNITTGPYVMDSMGEESNAQRVSVTCLDAVDPGSRARTRPQALGPARFPPHTQGSSECSVPLMTTWLLLINSRIVLIRLRSNYTLMFPCQFYFIQGQPLQDHWGGGMPTNRRKPTP